MLKGNIKQGFTLVELLVVVFIVGTLAAAIAPSWIGFVEGRRLTSERDELYSGIREAQSKAQIQSVAWQFSLRERNGFIEWATHPKSVPSDEAQWTALSSSSLTIHEETTFAISGDIYYVQFDNDGNVHYRLGRVTLSSRRVPVLKRCVIVSTIIGAMRKAKEQPVPQDGKLCY